MSRGRPQDRPAKAIKRFPDIAELRREIGEELFPFVMLVHESPKPSASDFDPVRLIRAVNGLHSLGMERALEVLTLYNDVCSKVSLGIVEQQRIFYVVRLLFVRKDGDPRMPPMRIGAFSLNLSADSASWPLDPLVLVHDLPFEVSQFVILAGFPQPPVEHIEYCREHCELRERPLAPCKTPQTALQELISSEQWKATFEGRGDKGVECRVVAHLRRQAFRCLADINERLDYAPKIEYCHQEYQEFDKAWERYVQNVDKCNPVWDSSQQAFLPTIVKND